MIEYGITIPHYIECLPNTMYVKSIEYGERTLKSGFELPTEHMDFEGRFVRPRWAKVLWKAENINCINVGDWVLLKHGHWSSSIVANVNGIDEKVWFISPQSYKEGVIAVSKEMPEKLSEYGIAD